MEHTPVEPYRITRGGVDEQSHQDNVKLEAGSLMAAASDHSRPGITRRGEHEMSKVGVHDLRSRQS